MHVFTQSIHQQSVLAQTRLLDRKYPVLPNESMEYLGISWNILKYGRGGQH